MIQPVQVSTAEGDRDLSTLPAPLPLDELVPGTGPWEVEIGFGKGRYLLRRCLADPDRRVLGIELVSEYSLVSVAREAEPLLREGGRLVTLTYYASEKVVPKYNVMGITKSALEASVRYLAYELGKKGVRVNAVSAGPVRTVAARSIPGFMKMYNRVGDIAPLGRNVAHEEVGNLGLFLLSPLAGGITGETVYVDAGYHVMGMELGE